MAFELWRTMVSELVSSLDKAEAYMQVQGRSNRCRQDRTDREASSQRLRQAGLLCGERWHCNIEANHRADPGRVPNADVCEW
jgi:hypothetical protein